MTPFAKAVTRLTNKPVEPTQRQVAVTLGPNDTITFREKGRRDAFILPVGAAYSLAVKIRVQG